MVAADRDLRPEVGVCREVDHGHRRWVFAPAEGIMLDHHAEVALDQRFVDGDTRYGQERMPAPVTTPG